MTADRAVLLLSGGLDSAALLALARPALALFVDYGQRPARAEGRAAAAVASALGTELEDVRVDLREIGGGLLHGDTPIPGAPSPEWWPYRNQLLVTTAAAVAVRRGLGEVLTATVASDGQRHADGTPRFYDALDAVLRIQEGAIRVRAPVIGMTSAELVAASGVGDDVLGWTVSCHRGDFPCGGCPGCWKRDEVLRGLGRMQPRDEQ
ncbi:MAG TPA: 7-cyano-7-deazaguanine synthase [Mycobacteriales bacterium]|nr:7-cyano-7-deazaguanine synthase [Mycobacteriales bacterium]